MSKDIDRIERVVKFVGSFILEFSALMPLIVILYREYSELSDSEIEAGFLSLRDDSSRLEEFRKLATDLPAENQRKQTLIDLSERAIEMCRFRAVIAHGILGGDRLHDDPEIVPNFFQANASYRSIILSEANMARYYRQLLQVSEVVKQLLPTGTQVVLGAHSIIIEGLGGKTSEEIFNAFGSPLKEREKSNKKVAIKFLYSVSRTMPGGAIMQYHNQERIQRVSGEPDESGMPTIRQLHIAERDFLEQWQLFEPNGYLIQYVSVPAIDSRGRYSEYRAYLGA